MEQKPDDRIEEEFAQFVQNREKIAKGFGDAMKYEAANTHFDAGKKGGWGSLEWTNKQQIVDNYAKPMEANKLNNERFGAQLERFGKERAEIKKVMDAQAAKTWPPAFKKMETSWRALTDDFDNKSASLLASEQVQKADLDAAWHAGADLDKAVIGDFLEFINDTKTQRKAFGGEVKTYIQNKQKINDAYKAAWEYEAANIKVVTEKDGDIKLQVRNEDKIIQNWSDAEFADIQNNEELKQDWINYQKSIAAEKAAFKATAKAEWPKKFDAYKAAANKCSESFDYPKAFSLITDAEQK